MIKGVILDLDQTIVNSSSVASFRKAKNWKRVFEGIPSFTVYDGWKDVFDTLQKRNIKIGIVTNAPSRYAKQTIDCFKIPYDCIVDYHSTYTPKPSAVPMKRCLELLGLEAHEVISFGDADTDVEAAQKTSILNYGCLWGNLDNDKLLRAGANGYLETTIDIVDLFNA